MPYRLHPVHTLGALEDNSNRFVACGQEPHPLSAFLTAGLRFGVECLTDGAVVKAVEEDGSVKDTNHVIAATKEGLHFVLIPLSRP